jgi:hypothetical protein
MTAKERKDLRLLILTGLRADARGRTARLLLNDARGEGIQATLPEVEDELKQMADASDIAVFDHPYAGPRWVITERGRMTLRDAGL